MKKTVKFFAGLLAFLSMGLSFSACSKEKKEKYLADQSNLYGVCYIAFEEVVQNENTDYVKIAELMNNMGVKSTRVWMRSNDLMKSPEEMNETACEKMHAILAELKKYDIQIIGMNARSFTKYNAWSSAVPLRDWSDGSYYSEWIEDLQVMWKNLVSEFPEIDYWEIGNETNNKRKYIYEDGREWKTADMTIAQMANVFTDELYYITQSVKAVDPDKQTILGGMTESTGLGSGLNKNFLQMIYNNIASEKYPSTDADDYFDCVAWHPYSADFNEDFFVQENDKVYQVILDNEGKGKKVFLTEVGWSDGGMEREEVAENLKAVYSTIAKRMPYVEAVHYFRLFNDAREYSWGGTATDVGFGLFTDPAPGTKYKDMYNGEVCIPGMPKPAAYAFQELAGGTGDLTILQDYYSTKN
ncbi:MAG: hypothetical protein IJY62_00205 [Clostridia bacterium]|nr:hypothetical protein [Clostridia bacterium]